MFKKGISSRKMLLAGLLTCVLVAGLTLGFTFKDRFHAHANSNVPAKYAFIVFVDGGHPELYNATNAPFLTSLKVLGANYTNAQAQAPADSITNIMGALSGTDATRNGFPYETFWDRHYNHLIELDETPVLPPGITEDRNVGRVCTLFQSAKAAGLSTSFISKYPAYDVVNGPNTCSVYSGPGVDNFQGPTFQDFTGTPQQFDQINFDSIRTQISSTNRPNVFGLYAVAPNTIMKQFGINSAEVAQVIQFEDQQIAQTVAALKTAGIYNQTEIVIANDHGNTALTQAVADGGPGSIDQFLNDNGIPTAQTTSDRVAEVWLQNPSQAKAAIALLNQPQNKTKFGIQEITPASGLGAYLVAPKDRTPDFIVWPMDGSNGTPAVVYGHVPLNKLAEHGGRGAADQNIMLIVVGPGVHAGYTTDKHVWVMQVGTTLATDMCLSLPDANMSVLPGATPDNVECEGMQAPVRVP